MRIILNEEEILTAIENYILENVEVPDDLRIDIDLKATRGDLGYTAEVDILAADAPAGDRSVDPRIEANQGAVEQGLGIVDKINEAKAQAAMPRRRGRPAGSRNKPKDVAVAATSETTGTLAAEPTGDAPVEAQPETDNEHVEVVGTETVVETPVENVAAEPVETQENTDVNEEVVSHTEVVVPEQPEEQPVEAEQSETVADQAALAEAVAEQPDPEPVAAPAATVQAQDVTEQANEVLAGEISDAAEVVQEPAEVEAAPEPEPEAEAVAEEEVAPQAPVPTEAPRSLFANLGKPTNEG